MIKIAVVDDHFAFRFGLNHLLNNNKSVKLEVILEASNGNELIEKLGNLKINNENNLPEIVLLDVYMPIKDGKETAEYLSKEYPNLKIIFFSVFLDDYLITEFIKKGVLGFLTKNATTKELIEALKTVYSNKIYIDKQFELQH